MSYLSAANSVPMFLLCLMVVVVVLTQPIVMSRMARKRGLEIGLTKEDMNKAVKSSAIFALIPSMPVLASYLVLVPALGKYFPWMRLSVVGSVTYETTVATMAANAFGYENIYTSDFPVSVYLSLLLILTVGILGGNFFNLFFLKSYDRTVKKLVTRNANFLPILTTALFVALYGTFSAMTLTNTADPVGILTFFAAGGVAVLMGNLAKRYPKLKEHAFSLSLLGGMASACVLSLFIG